MFLGFDNSSFKILFAHQLLNYFPGVRGFRVLKQFVLSGLSLRTMCPAKYHV